MLGYMVNAYIYDQTMYKCPTLNREFRYGTVWRKLDKNLWVMGKKFACIPYSTCVGACAQFIHQAAQV